MTFLMLFFCSRRSTNVSTVVAQQVVLRAAFNSFAFVSLPLAFKEASSPIKLVYQITENQHQIAFGANPRDADLILLLWRIRRMSQKEPAATKSGFIMNS